MVGANRANILKRTKARTKYRGTVSAEESGSETTVFYIISLQGLGDDFFNDAWWAQVTSTTDDGAPVGITRNISDYVSDTGQFTTAAFTANVNTGDTIEILHEDIYSQGAVDNAALGTTVDDDGTQTSITLERGLVDRVGNTDDAASSTGTVLARLQFIEDNLIPDIYGMSWQGTISGVGAPATTTFSVAELIGYGDGFFDEAYWVQPISATVGAIEGQWRKVSTYTSATGTFVVAAAFGGNTTVSDEVIIVHENIRAIGAIDDAATTDDMTDIATTSLSAKARLILNRMSPNAFTATIQGNADTALDTMIADMATYISAAGAAYSVNMANYGAKTNIEQTLEDFAALFGVPTTTVLTNINNTANLTFDAVFQKLALLWGADDANIFLPTIYGGTRANLELALDNVALYMSPAGAAWSVQSMNQVADVNLETTWEQWLTTVGVDGTNVWTNLSGVTPATLDAIIQSFATTIGINGANTFAPAMFGLTPGTIEGAFEAIDVAIGSEYDGSPDLYDTLVTGFDSSATAANVDGSVHEVLKYIQGATGIFFEQADVPYSAAIDNVGVDVLDYNTANTRYIIRDMRLKLDADPLANTLTVSLETLINDVATVVDTFDINTANWGTAHTLMDMFGVPTIAGDDIHIFATYSVAGPITLKGQWSHAKTLVT